MPDETNSQVAPESNGASEPTKRGAKDKRTEMEKLRDQSAIMRLALRGWQQKQIAVELNLSEAMVSRDMRDVREALKKSRLNDMKAMFARELAKIDELEREAWAAWEASKGVLETTVTTGQEGKGKKAQLKKQQRNGDPRYHETIKWCIRQRLEIFGLLAPDRLDVTSGGEVLNARELSDDELARIAARSSKRAS